MAIEPILDGRFCPKLDRRLGQLMFGKQSRAPPRGSSRRREVQHRTGRFASG